jgi:shikimate dehydrogenase
MIDEKTGLVALIGNPIGHSLSPIMHNTAFRHLGLNYVYLAFCVRNLKVAVDAMRELGFRGYSVTIPHKENIIKHLDRVEPLAGKIQAVNTVVNKGGVLVGYNTDAEAAIKALRQKTILSGKSVALIGAGGAARAIAFALQKENSCTTIFNRTFERAKRLARAAGCDYMQFEKVRDFEADILVNATSVGMFPRTNESPVEKSAFESRPLVFDVVYNPTETLLLKQAKAAGCETISGIEMFVEQGAEQFRLWTGKEPPVGLMRDAVRKRLEE